MDLPLILEKLGYTQTTGEPFWGGPCATTNSTYEEMATHWPQNNPPLSGKDIFESTWEEILIERSSNEYKEQRVVSGYSPIADQLDMLYWDISSGVFGESAKSSHWFQTCSGVKSTYPKSS